MTLDERLVDLLMRAEDLRAEGVAVSPAELCRDFPELLPDLERLLQGTGAVEQLLHAQECAADENPTSPDVQAPATPAPGPARPQRHLPGYDILGELGRGGMGVVYKARHLALGRIVALKVIRGGAHASPHDLARFRREAEAAARLSHPNIVQVYEVGESEGLPYCALEYVEGSTLAQHLRSGEMAPREAAELMEALAGAVHLAHSRNIVHRDLKPANVLLAACGVATLATPQAAMAKITDFGLARRLDDDNRQTQTGAIVGTPSYMAPEQAAGHRHAVGPPADVWALGAILYECLTGQPPFAGKSALDILDQVRHRDPLPPSRLNRRVPRDLETICLKCLRKEPEQRYGSAQQLADDLGRFRRGEPVMARPIGSAERLVKWARRRPAVAALLLALLVATPVVLTLALEAWDQENRARLDTLQLKQQHESEQIRRDTEQAAQKRKNDEIKQLWTRTDALGHNPRGADDSEREALWQLTRDKDHLKRLFFESLLTPESGAVRLARRAEAALRAGVGFDSGRRDALAALLKERLAGGTKAKPEVRAAYAAIALALRAPDAQLSRQACRALLEEMRSQVVASPPARPNRPPPPPEEEEIHEGHDEVLARDAHGVVVLTAALEPNEAAEFCADALLIIADQGQQMGPNGVGPALGELAERLPLETALRVARTILDRGTPAGRTLEVLVKRLSPEQFSELAEHGTSTLLATMTNASDEPTSSRQAALLAVLAPGLSPELAQRAMQPLLDRIASAKPGAPWPLVQALAVLAERLPPDQTARYARLGLADLDRPDNDVRSGAYRTLLPHLIERLTPEQAAALAPAVFRELPANAAEGRDLTLPSQLARRLSPEEAARWAESLMDRTLAPGERHLWNWGVLLICDLAGRLPPAQTAELCGRLSAAILDEMSRTGANNWLVDLLVRLTERLSPDQVAEVACGVLGMVDRHSKFLASSPRPVPGESSPLWADHELLTLYVKQLDSIAKALPAEQAADLDAAALQYLLGDPVPPGQGWDEEWVTMATGLAERLSPEQAGTIARFLVDELNEEKNPDRRGVVLQVLVPVAAHLSPEAAAGLFPDLLALRDPTRGPARAELDKALAAMAERVSAKEAAKPVPDLLARVKRMGDDAVFAADVQPLAALAAALPPDEAAFLTKAVIDRMDRAENQRVAEDLTQTLVRLGKQLPPEKLDEMAGTLLGMLEHSGGFGPLNEGPRNDEFGGMTVETGRAVAFTKVLAGWADRLSPDRAGAAARIIINRIARTLPPLPPSPLEPGMPGYRPGMQPEGEEGHADDLWSNLMDRYHEGLGALAPRAGEQALLDLLKSPDCVERRAVLVREVLEKQLGTKFADPWAMADWLRQHRPDLDLTTTPQRLDSEMQP